MRLSGAVICAMLLGCGHTARHDDQVACDELSGACCRGNADCASPSNICLAPNEFAGCGACQAGDGCQSDSNCAGGIQICEVPVCSCASEKACITGCADDASCGLGLACGADHRCRAKTCATATDCPDFFICGTGSTCARKPCTSDVDCDGGACVNGHCYETLGNCTSPPA